uniref:F-box/LRR-repeat protein 15/At3g58940/PEG3-like LRR domain-containing protein n=1 Tax=Aegilops tauschii subsp. strangulata TaxID=200361 RepID=A0A453SUK4_AEGTS
GDPHLARLSLGAMTVGLPDSFSARSHPFSALEVIHLHCVRISDGTLRSLVAACPLLHTLDLRYCEGLYFISVAAAGARPRSLTVAQCGSDTEVFLADDASGLRSFHYSGAYMPAYRIPATTALADLYICFGGPERRGRRRNWLQLLTNLSNLTVLTLCSRVLRVRRSLHFMPSGLISILSYCLIDNFLRCYALQRLSAEARARLVATSAAPCKLLNLRELQLLMFALEIDNMNDIYCFLVTCCGPRLERLFVQVNTSCCIFHCMMTFVCVHC